MLDVLTLIPFVLLMLIGTPASSASVYISLAFIHILKSLG